MRPQNRHLKPFKAGSDWTGNRLGRPPKRPEQKAATSKTAGGMEGYVYFIRAGDAGPIKIGFTSRDVRHRFAALQTASPVPLTTIAAIWSPMAAIREIELHMRYDAMRVSGEWFDLDDAALSDAIGLAGRL